MNFHCTFVTPLIKPNSRILESKSLIILCLYSSPFTHGQQLHKHFEKDTTYSIVSYIPIVLMVET